MLAGGAPRAACGPPGRAPPRVAAASGPGQQHGALWRQCCAASRQQPGASTSGAPAAAAAGGRCCAARAPSRRTTRAAAAAPEGAPLTEEQLRALGDGDERAAEDALAAQWREAFDGDVNELYDYVERCAPAGVGWRALGTSRVRVGGPPRAVRTPQAPA